MTKKRIAFLKFQVKLYSIIFLFIIIESPSFVCAQEDEIKFSHITVEDGLTSNGVIQVLQDRNGFIWLGTYNGLNRFDGYNFKAFLPEPNNPTSISNHSIWALAQDDRGNIWCGTQDGLNKYDPITEQFLRYKNNSKDRNSISNDHIYCIHKDATGILWIGTLNGLNRYNPATNNFTVFKRITPIPNPDSLNSVTCIQEDIDGNLWLGTWNGVIKMRKDGKILNSYFEDDPNESGLNYRKINCLFKDNSQNIWVGTSTLGLQKYDVQTKKFVAYRNSKKNPYSISNENITAIYQDKMNNIWAGTKNGLNKLNTETNQFTRVLNDPQKPLSIINNEILSIFEDNNSLMWVGNSGGVSRFYQTTNHFGYIQENINSPKLGLTNSRIAAITIDDKNNIWVGTLDGINKIEYNKKIIAQIRRSTDPNSIGSGQIMSIHQDRTGAIWIGTNDVSLNRYNPSTGENKQFVYSTKDSNTISNEGVTTICEDRKGNMWFGTWWGLNKYDRTANKFFRFFANKNNSNGLRVDLIWKVIEDSEGMIWIGTDGGGISRLNPETKIFTNFFRDSIHTNTISGNIGVTIFESRDGMMWFGTNNGLDRYDRKTGKFKSYSKENGLPGIFINSIVEDNRGFLWIGTDKGLSRFDRRTETFTNFGMRDGLKDLDFSARVSAIDKDGILYFGTKRGLLFFDPSKIKERNSTAPIAFTDLKIYNQSVPITTDGSTILNRSIIGAANIEIPYKDDVITLEFSLLDYYNIRENVFSYKLEGFDNKWNMVGSRNSATYTNLPPGEYRFIVRAYNSSGIKNQKETSLIITIVPTFYQTIWFKVLGFLFLIALTILYVQSRTKKIFQINRTLEFRVAERTKDLDTTINELSTEILERKKAEEKVQASLAEKEILLKEVHHRVKNNLQVVSSLLYLQSLSVKDEATLALFKDSQNRIKSMALIHEKLYQSKDFSRIVFRDYVNSFLEHLNSSHKNQGLAVRTDVHIDNMDLSLDTAISCGLIVNELMTNAYKYAFPPEWLKEQASNYFPLIEIGAKSFEENQFQLIVHDNGIGIASSVDIETSDSLGLKIVNSMVNQLNGTIAIKKGNGTTFEITFKQL
jgi:two-component sensor histidine kinase/ligand-binding sensor domain-containing protein